ncbi:MAG: MmcQ/YjbR family DNA-binding protein [Alphaproteobacteria bacterium]|nr:MmcQ/YjbR family DNA-binding protein [Alphaproteobacteria bacterium]MBN9579193.1 MmcQ/YjbR family DNA-binding protein [Alphaproteobacteria bacterium]
MASAGDVRKFALAHPGVEEIAHWGRPAYRTKKRIFAVMRPAEKRVYLHLPEERKDFLFAAAPDVFIPEKWGKSTSLLVHLPAIAAAELRGLIAEAWQSATPPPGKKRRAK